MVWQWSSSWPFLVFSKKLFGCCVLVLHFHCLRLYVHEIIHVNLKLKGMTIPPFSWIVSIGLEALSLFIFLPSTQIFLTSQYFKHDLSTYIFDNKFFSFLGMPQCVNWRSSISFPLYSIFLVSFIWFFLFYFLYGVSNILDGWYTNVTTQMYYIKQLLGYT